MRSILLLFLFLLANAHAQVAINGPMLGHVDMLEARLWLQCHGPCSASIRVWPMGSEDSVMFIPAQRSEARSAHVLTFTLSQLRPGTEYTYQVLVNGVAIPFDEPPIIRTLPLWKHRMDPPAFSMALGSCTYINEEAYDRPGEPFGREYGIFDAIAEKRPDLMLWLGDNIYLRESDWGSRSGYLHRYTHTRSALEIQRLLRSTKHYAIWDDHDFGPNDADGSWVHSAFAHEAFDLFWANPSAGVPGAEGTNATSFSHGDVDFFLLDNRTYRVPGELLTSPPALLGNAQLDWLIRALNYSDAPFKIVAVGGQVLNSAAMFENYATITEERKELLQRIELEGIKGVVFLSGDRHFGELSTLTLTDGRTLYDLTSSPLTSRTYVPQEENKNRVEGTLVTENNFGMLRFAGKKGQRTMTMSIHNAFGILLWERTIQQDK